MKLGRRKLRSVALLGAVAFIGLLFFWDTAVSGTMFALGAQDLSTEEGRFQDTGESDSKGNFSEEIRQLSETEYRVTQENATEQPFRNEYYDNERPGIYVDVVSGEPLFSSKHKFDSGTGWPSFYRPLEPENIVERKDPGPLGTRVEIASSNARSHLGHLFSHPDTPTGLRYCLNSAALEFVPAEELEEQGYGQYTEMFEMEQS